MFSAVISTVHS